MGKNRARKEDLQSSRADIKLQLAYRYITSERHIVEGRIDTGLWHGSRASAARGSTLIIYLLPSVRVSHIDPLGRVKCNVVCSVATAHKGRDAHVGVCRAHLHARRALLSATEAEERVESIDRPIQTRSPPTRRC